MGKAPDLLAGLEEEKPVVTGPMDLLSQITEDDGIAWMPWNDDEQPHGLQGIVTAITTVATDAKFGEVREVPLVTFITDDEKVWSIRGYGKVVESQLASCVQRGMMVGDHFAIKYLGDKQGKGGAREYHNVKAAFAKSN